MVYFLILSAIFYTSHIFSMSLPDGVSPRKHYSVDEKDDLAEFFTFAREGDFAGMAELLERDDFVVKQENLY